MFITILEKEDWKHWKHDTQSNLSRTNEFLLLLFTHPVDSEAGGGSKTTSQDFLVGLGPPVSN